MSPFNALSQKHSCHCGQNFWLGQNFWPFGKNGQKRSEFSDFFRIWSEFFIIFKRKLEFLMKIDFNALGSIKYTFYIYVKSKKKALPRAPFIKITIITWFDVRFPQKWLLIFSNRLRFDSALIKMSNFIRFSAEFWTQSWILGCMYLKSSRNFFSEI